MYIDVEKSSRGTDTQWIAESGILDLFLLLGPTPAKVRLALLQNPTAAASPPQCHAAWDWTLK